MPDVQQRLLAMEAEPATSTPAELDALVARCPADVATLRDRQIADPNAERVVKWDLDTNVQRRMAYNHYFQKAAAPAARKEVSLREAGRLHGPGVHRVHADAAAGELGADAAGERELRVLGGRVRP